MNNSLPSTRRSLPIALIRARENAMLPIREMLAKTGLTEQQWRVLRVLSEFGPQDATELSERACLLLPSLTRMVRSMAEKGLITREQDQSDRRRQMLAITDAGQRIIDDNYEQGLRVVEGFKARLGEDKYEQLLDLLELFSDPPERKS
ncbi:homoprotocatechuate degradation operon regulator HpaR [Flavimaricola marinus]|nr:homoprotocatechuate degradation operon regulator HpaR [Flavimaricola marinus]